VKITEILFWVFLFPFILVILFPILLFFGLREDEQEMDFD